MDPRITIGIGNIIIECEFNEVIVVIMNRESIIPSRHRSVDMKWKWNTSVFLETLA